MMEIEKHIQGRRKKLQNEKLYDSSKYLKKKEKKKKLKIWKVFMKKLKPYN